MASTERANRELLEQAQAYLNSPGPDGPGPSAERLIAHLIREVLRLQAENEYLTAEKLGLPLDEFLRRRRLDAQAAQTLAQYKEVEKRKEDCPNCQAGLKHRHASSEEGKGSE